jgi:hypothetical protein
MEGRDQTNKGTKDKSDSEKVQEVRDQATKYPTDQPSNMTTQGSAQPRWTKKQKMTTLP